eukprot:Opistho-2@930
MSWLPRFKLTQLTALAFNNVLNPLNRRHGASVFAKPRNHVEEIANYYAPVHKWKTVLTDARRDGFVFHEDEEYREDRASFMRRRGKAPPKKGQGKRNQKAQGGQKKK